MIICPNCQFQELAGALFCSDCGENLVFEREILTKSLSFPVDDNGRHEPSEVQMDYAPEDAITEPPPPQTAAFASVDALFSLYLIDIGEYLSLAGKETFTLGRINEDQPIIPDVDLSPYKALEHGVSRLHATLQINQQVTVTDLGSSNGTQVNRKKIQPQKTYPLKHGDTLTLGKMRIQVLIRQ